MGAAFEMIVALTQAGQPVPASLLAQHAAETGGTPYTGGGILASGQPNLDAWVATPSPVVQAISPAVIPAIGGLILTAIRALIAQFGLRTLILGILSAIGFKAIKELADETGQGIIETAVSTLIPGQQEWLGEWPAGLGQIEGRLVQKWTAGGAKVYFASFEQPTRSGSHIQYYVWSAKRQAWLPYSYRRNIVFGARELDIAAALGGKRRIGKKTALRALAGKYGGTRSKGAK